MRLGCRHPLQLGVVSIGLVNWLYQIWPHLASNLQLILPDAGRELYIRSYTLYPELGRPSSGYVLAPDAILILVTCEQK